MTGFPDTLPPVDATVPTATGPRLGVLVSHLRPEEKLILAAARSRGIAVAPLFDRDLVLDLAKPAPSASGLAVDVVLDRCVAHQRGLYALRALERWGVPTLNTAAAVAVCDDKAQTSIALEAAGVPTPRTLLAFDTGSALAACEAVGYPAVLKPITGSWGRLLAKVNGPEQARAVLAQKAEHGSFHHEVIYVQEFVAKPGRDIRAYVVGDRVLAASYRSAPHWVTNSARGAVSTPCPVTPEIEALALRACAAVGARLAGVDLFEVGDGFQVVEVNSGGEFKGLMTTTDVDIAAEIVAEALRVAARRTPAPTPA
ncbi:MAG: Alpha-aminoadipate--LysW ligase (EC [uncultured Thermomicrobiales bacterium]|uniref:Alpha-aminoadipate--LysW ligase (EC) n=1 Tax=uncultured Thermomicrobiales bacterium TaxID=1645740 RepID=A0A6J4V7K0_9BACT|nr:MAG: Alpha-aminoadipate--LysW ligase (EC [uncultured Thermomicrobiales bacterium]